MHYLKAERNWGFLSPGECFVNLQEECRGYRTVLRSAAPMDGVTWWRWCWGDGKAAMGCMALEVLLKARPSTCVLLQSQA